MKPNKKQQEVIENTKGIYIVDAGAGTGKTQTLTQRYIEILNTPTHPDDILFITFTKNAARNMKEKVLSKVEPHLTTQIVEAPILNFDSFCFKIVSKYGLHAPKILGINNTITGFKLIKESVIQKRYFNKFFNQFLEEHQHLYEELLTQISNPQEIHTLLEQLLSKGVYPKKKGWFLDGEKKLKGEYEEYLKRFARLNEESFKKNGSKKNSYLVNSFNQQKNYLDLPEDVIVENQINAQYAKDAFNEDTQHLRDFIHHIYYNYIDYMVQENLMTFSLTAMFAFLILYEDDEIRNLNSFEYIMVDEFQDTNEMQFQLLLLLLKQPNLCVVGDWKQGIYGFRNASISNIKDFKNKIQHYKQEVNKDNIRVSCELDHINTQEFDINYRSSQKILDFSQQSLVVNGKKNELQQEAIENIQKEITSLKSEHNFDDTSEITCYQAVDRETEISYILQKIQELVNHKTITYFDPTTQEYKQRTIEYQDIAILSRNRTFGLEIQKKAHKHNIPAVYEGGINVFEEEEAVLLLAWLKLLLSTHKSDALLPILEKENYSSSQIKHILTTKEYPQDIIDFRNHLRENKKTISYVVDEIFKRYQITNPVSNKLLSILDEVFHSTLMSISEIIVFIEENIEQGETYTIEVEGSTNSITIQTIHASKGLEYPIVFIVNCNQSNFPMNSSNSSSLTFHELVGVRSKKVFSRTYNYVFDNWKTELVNQGLFSDLDEERRLLYVAITRAMYDVYITSHRPSEFFKGLSKDNYEYIETAEVKTLESQSTSTTNVLEIPSFVQQESTTLSAHNLMTFKQGQRGRGKEFGDKIHRLAFRYSQGLPISSIKEEFKQDFQNITSYIDNNLKNAKLQGEIDCSLLLGKTMIRGIIDLVAEFQDRVEILDWKSDLVKDNLDEYTKQLSIYYHVLKEEYPNKTIHAKLFWTHSGEVEEIEPLKKEELLKLLG